MTATKFRVAYIDRPMYPSFVAVLQARPEIELVRIDSARGDDPCAALLADCDGYYVQASRDELPLRWHVSPELIAAMPRLSVVASYGAGCDTIDVDACTAAGVAVVSQAGGNAQAVAEHAVGMMIALLKRMPESMLATRAGSVTRREAFIGRELSGKTIGIVGLGHTGSSTARLVRAFGCNVLAFDPYLDEATCAERGATKVGLAALLTESDVVSLHCPLTAETRGLFDGPAIATMRRGSIFVNTARGSICDEAALHQALSSGQLAGVGLDVWEREPPPADHPLLRHPAVMATPHMAGVTHESRDRVARLATEPFIEAAAGKLPTRLVNPEVAAAYSARRAALVG